VFRGENVLVTGGSGLIGRHLIKLLIEKGANVSTVVGSRSIPKEYSEKIQIFRGDLSDYNFCKIIMKDVNHVFHCAAFVGGIKQNLDHPATMLSKNLVINSNVIKATNQSNIERFLFMSCNCAYPDMEGLIKEDMAWQATPASGAIHFGWMKRIGELESQAYQEEFGLKVAIVRPSKDYGPGDFYDKHRSHAVPALIMKATQHTTPFKIWGDGTSKRDFLYAEDVARGTILALEKHAIADPINICSGIPVSINELASKILKISGFEEAKIIHESLDLSGASSRVLDPSKAKEKLDFNPEYPLEKGLKITIDSYLKNGS